MDVLNQKIKELKQGEIFVDNFCPIIKGKCSLENNCTFRLPALNLQYVKPDEEFNSTGWREYGNYYEDGFLVGTLYTSEVSGDFKARCRLIQF